VPDLCQCPKIEAGGRCEEPECSFAHHTSELHGLSGSETNPNSNDVVKPHRDHFYKTKLCKFHLKGSCLRGAKCRYAHDLSSQCPLPDLQCTRLCPMLTRTGECKDTSCCLAPKAHELEVVQSMQPEMCETVQVKLVEKLTFLEWEPDVPTIRRCASAPGSMSVQ